MNIQEDIEIDPNTACLESLGAEIVLDYFASKQPDNGGRPERDGVGDEEC